MTYIPTKIQAARHLIVQRLGYFADALWSLIPIERKEIRTAGVDDKWRLYYDPDLFEELKVGEVAAILLHEMLHMIRDHFPRGQGLEKVRWNLAADMEINDDILDIQANWPKLILPDWAVTNKKFGFPEGLLAEQYYGMIKTKTITIDIKMLSGQCGSGAGGEKQDWEIQDGPGKREENSEEGDVGGISQIESELIKRQVAQKIKNAVGTDPGSVPASLKRWADALLEPKVDWHKVLSRKVRGAVAQVRGCVDYSMKFPSKRWPPYHTEGGRPVIPGMVAPDPSVAIVADSSGSMGEADLNTVIGETKGILRSIGTREAEFISVDCKVHASKKVRSSKEAADLLGGGGGTDMGVGLRRAAELRPRPNVVIVLTDGETPWPAEKPPFKVIVGLVRGDPGYCPVPEWAESVHIQPKVE